MKEFMLIFINNYNSERMASPEQMETMMKQWKLWIDEIEAKGKLSYPGNRLGNEGKIVKPNNLIIDGPFTESKEIVGGYLIIHSNSLDEAVEIAKGCPILQAGGSVEVRNVVEMVR